MVLRTEQSARPFLFERDTFAFANELFWEYRFDDRTGLTTTVDSSPPPAYAHRCFVMVRSIRQFLYHARFAPELPTTDPASYQRLIREVVARSPRRVAPDEQRVVIPGYDGLRAFSRAHEPLLKAECGSAWESYFVRSHWRMVFPVWRRHQEGVARQLVRALRERPAPIVHLFRFPRISINHGIVLFGSNEGDRELQFDAYDPNIPAHPVKLIFDRAGRTFRFPRQHYWAGGWVNVIEAYRGGLY